MLMLCGVLCIKGCVCMFLEMRGTPCVLLNICNSNAAVRSEARSDAPPSDAGMCV